MLIFLGSARMAMYRSPLLMPLRIDSRRVCMTSVAPSTGAAESLACSEKKGIEL